MLSVSLIFVLPSVVMVSMTNDSYCFIIISPESSSHKKMVVRWKRREKNNVINYSATITVQQDTMKANK